MHQQGNMSDIFIPSFFVTAETYISLQLSVFYRGKTFTPKSAIFGEEGLMVTIGKDHKPLEYYSELFFVPVLFVLFSISLILVSCCGSKRSSIQTINPLILARFPIIEYNQLKSLAVKESICAII